MRTVVSGVSCRVSDTVYKASSSELILTRIWLPNTSPIEARRSGSSEQCSGLFKSVDCESNAFLTDPSNLALVAVLAWWRCSVVDTFMAVSPSGDM